MLVSALFVGCTTTSVKTTEAKKSIEVRASSPAPSQVSPIHLSIVAPSHSSGEQSEPVSIYPLWKCAVRTVPSGQPLLIWVNEEKEPKIFSFGKNPEFHENVRLLRFVSVTEKSTLVEIVLYPPGITPDLRAR